MIDKTNPAIKTYTKGSISCLTNAKKGLFFLSLSLYTDDISVAKPIAQICLPKKQKEHYYDENYI